MNAKEGISPYEWRQRAERAEQQVKNAKDIIGGYEQRAERLEMQVFDSESALALVLKERNARSPTHRVGG